MSSFSTALTHALDSTGTSQAKFCEQTGIGQSPMSRYVRGTSPVGPEVVAKIVRTLEAPHNAAVLAAWLSDGVPKGLTDLVIVKPNTSAIKEESDVLPPNIDRELRTLLNYFARKAVDHPAIRDMLANLRTALEAE